MGLLEIVQLIGGVFKFLDQVKWLIQTLQGTPEANHEALMKTLKGQAENYQKTGRPTWD